MFPRELAESRLFDTVVASHLASDTWTMCGTIHRGFQLSQKIKGIGDPPITRKLERRTGHGSKPIAMIPPAKVDADTIGDPEWARLERRYADAGFSLTAQYAGFAAVSLVLRLVEHAALVDMDKLVKSSFRQHAASAHVFNQDLSFSEVVETLGRGNITAVDYQELLAHTALDLSEKIELPQDEQDAIPLWLAICDELRACDLSNGQYGKLLTMLDFAPRHRYLSTRFSESELDSRNAPALEANLTWDRVLPAGGAMTFWDGIVSPYVTIEEVNHFVTNAPPTRAEIRAKLIGDPDRIVTYTNWASMQLSNGRTLDIDPYATLK
jgi:hypothetical protein